MEIYEKLDKNSDTGAIIINKIAATNLDNGNQKPIQNETKKGTQNEKHSIKYQINGNIFNLNY